MTAQDGDSDLIEVMRALAAALNVPEEDIHPQTSMKNFGKWDSLQCLFVIAALEKKFQFRFKPSEMFHLTSVESIVKTVKNRRDEIDAR